MDKKLWSALTLVLALGISGAALAKTENKVVNLFLKAGAGRYTAGYTSYTGYGATWGGGFGIQPVSFFGFEIAYEGSHHSTQGLLFPNQIDGRPGILRSGVDALLKLSAPIDWFRPFIGVGFGVAWLTPTGPNTSFLQSTFIEELPLAGGLEFAFGPVLLGARFTYRFLFNNNVIQDPARAKVNGGFGDVQVTGGVRF